jgi:putative membrane protein
MENPTISRNQTPYTVIGILSVAIPLVVAYLLFGGKATKIEGLNVSLLPHLNAVMNSATFISLVAGGIAIRQKDIALHRTFMMSAFVLSSIFLVSYVIYHNNAESTAFPKENALRYVYLVLLLTHILLSMVVVPLVLLAIYFAWTNQIANHKKIVKWTYPVWLYVAGSGVLVYLMISPYYVH